MEVGFVWFFARLKRDVDRLMEYRAAFERELGVMTAEDLSASEGHRVCFRILAGRVRWEPELPLRELVTMLG